MKYRTLLLSTLAFCAGVAARADNMASMAINPATGAVTLTPRWTIGPNLAGFHHMAQDLGIGGTANNFYSIVGTPISNGGNTSGFNYYTAATGAATPHADIGSKLRPNSYSALTSADPDLGFGAINLYLIHHQTDGDYLTAIVPGSGSSSAVTDLKPMSQPGGPTTGGLSGYFGLTFAAADLGYGLNLFYYLRTDAITGNDVFGSVVPGLAGASTDIFNLGETGYNAVAFASLELGFGTNRMYYLRLDPITEYTILGTLNPATGKLSDIANLGSVFSTLAFVPGDVGFGGMQFYTTGPINPTWQSVSFAAIADQASGVPFNATPSASSTLPITLTVVSGSTGAASISGPVAGVFTITPTAPGVVTLQAAQEGQLAPTAFEGNMLRQTFTVTGAVLLKITTQPTPQSAAVGTTATFTVSTSGTSSRSYQWRKDGNNIGANASATTATLNLTNVQASDNADYDVVVTNLSGSIISDSVGLLVTTPTPVITNSPLSAGATVGTPFTFTITASGVPTSYSAVPLPAGLSINTSTGAITGTPSAAGSTGVLLGATNATGTGHATLTVTVAAAGVAPIITNSPLSAAGTVGTAFNFTIAASGSPTSYSASPLPAGLSINTSTGAITGSPTTVGMTSVLLGATNATGTGNATLSISVSAAGTAPIIVNNPLTAAGTVGTPFSFSISASGSPTSYTATPLPAGLSIVASTGAITGTPTTAGMSTVQLGATNSTGTGNATLTVTIAAAGATPTVTNSPPGAGATIGTPFNYTITASGTPTSFSASPLPAGLSINTATGSITGTPTTAGVTSVILGATNSTGTGNKTLSITVAAASAAPVITSSMTAPAIAGTPFTTYLIEAAGSPTSYAATGLPPGLTVNTSTGAINGTPTTAGSYVVTVSATNSNGTTSASLTITVDGAPAAPVISSPADVTVAPGAPFSYTIVGSNTPTSYAATGLPPGLTLDASTGVISGTPTTAGDYSVTVSATNSTGTTNLTLTIHVVVSGSGDTSSRIVNFSARAISGPGSQTLIMGFVVSGDGLNLLVRGIGPGLTPYGISNALADPYLTLFGTSGVLSTNDDWQTPIIPQPTGAPTAASGDLISSTSASVGAFALPANSKDAAMIFPVGNGAHTTGLLRPNSTTGVALTEIYVINDVPGTRLINVSARMNVTTGAGTLIAGLVISGNAPKTVLIRGVGPGLTSYGVTGVLVDPIITVYTGNTWMASNDNWETGATTAAELMTTFARVGAFPLVAASKDAALLISLEPGLHTVHVTGVSSTSGVALIEIYDAE